MQFINKQYRKRSRQYVPTGENRCKYIVNVTLSESLLADLNEICDHYTVSKAVVMRMAFSKFANEYRQQFPQVEEDE